MNLSPLRRRLIVVAITALVPAGAALATPGFGLTPTIIARGTSSETFSINEPRHKANLRKSRAIIACALDRQCDFVFQTITFQPGGHTGWHSHPGVLFVTVESGAVTRYEQREPGERNDDDDDGGGDDDRVTVESGAVENNCERNTYAAGQSFIERGPRHVILVRNEGTTPAKVQIAYVVPAGTANAALRIDQPAPADCNP
jgi:hypothetical protein